jgi:uncharacterized membrane protein
VLAGPGQSAIVEVGMVGRDALREYLRGALWVLPTTMITIIALLLGLAVVALQLSSTQFSPRLLRNFLRDRPNQVVLSAFVATRRSGYVQAVRPGTLLP